MECCQGRCARRIFVLLLLLLHLTMRASGCVPGQFVIRTIGCFTCSAGTYCPGNDTSLTCAAGTFSSAGQAACCQIGQYYLAGACVKCLAGSYCPDGINLKTCAAGTSNPKLSSSNVSACVQCAPGMYNPNAGSSTCAVAPPGTFTNSSGSSSFQLCLPGTYSPGYGSTGCLQCPAGTTTQQLGMSQCQALFSCPAGTYVDTTGCVQCPAGQYSSIANALQCTPCPIGSYRAEVGGNSSAQCVRCPSGTYGEQEGAVSASMCTPCPAGSFGPLMGATSSAACRLCPPGSFGGTTGASSSLQCASCLAGTYTAYAGATSCDACDAGTYGISAGGSSSSSCLPCPSGTWGLLAGGNSSAACLPCEAGTYTPDLASTSCLPCPPGYYATARGSSACLPCPVGTFNTIQGANASSACIPCPAGYYGLSPAATSNTTCIACSAGQYSPTAGATSFTACRLCAAGSYGETSGSPACKKCPPGTSSIFVGSTTGADCTPCDLGTYGNTSGLTKCAVCDPGTFQNASGQMSCVPCAVGTASPLQGSILCLPCLPGTYAAQPGQGQCTPCAPGTLQLDGGKTSCSTCPSLFSDLPAPLLSASFEVDVCGSLSRAVVLNWGPVDTPLLLAANVTIENPWASWLDVRVTGAKILTFTSDMIPASASINGTLNIAVSVMHTCRTLPWVGVVSFTFYRSDPAFLVKENSVGFGATVEACPNFLIQYTAFLGTCTSQTVVVATLGNGSALPPFVSYAYGSGVLEIVGTLPPGQPPFNITAVALLGQETFISAPIRLMLAPSSSVLILPTSNLLVIKACPYVSVTFSIRRSTTCGRLRAGVTFANGSGIPSFLSVATQAAAANDDATTLTVYGTVPAGFAAFSIVAFASLGIDVYTSTSISIVRPALVSTANVSITVETAASPDQNGSASSQNVPLELSALYGVPTHITAWVDGGTEPLCSSLSIIVSNSAADGNQQGQSLQLPVWISVTMISATSVLISANPTIDVALGAREVLYVWANDGQRNPGFNLSIVAKTSLRVGANRTMNTSGNTRVPFVVTPASLLQLQTDVVGGGTARPVLICPTSAVAAFCSVAVGESLLGAFGTPAGINDVLQNLSFSLPAGASAANSTMLQLTFKDSINPSPLTVQIPLTALRTYAGVRLIKVLQLSAKVGKPLAEAIRDYFISDENGPIVVTLTQCNASWLSVQGGYLGGTPTSPPALIYFTLVASDKFTNVVASGTVNVTWPMSPVAHSLALSRWVVISSMQLDVQLQADVITDPEGGTILFDLLQYTGSPDLQPLPLFLKFDAHNVRMIGLPQAGDVGTYTLVIIGTSTWGPSWKGNATSLLTVIVQQSWTDFFAWVYSITGYCASAIGVVTWALVYRAHLINIVTFSRRMKYHAPTMLCRTGRYTVGTHSRFKPTPANRVKAVQCLLINKPALECSRNRILELAYFSMQNRLSDTKVQPNLVAWLSAVPSRKNTLDLVVDLAVLQHHVATGRVMTDDEFYVEVISNGRWSSGSIIEAFTFRVSDVLSTKEGVNEEEPPSSNVTELAREMAEIKGRLLAAEAKVTHSDLNTEQLIDLLRLEIASLNQDVSKLKVPRSKGRKIDSGLVVERSVDPYTGHELLQLPIREDEGVYVDDEEMQQRHAAPLLEL